MMENDFDWVIKAKSNTVLYRKIYDPVLNRDVFTKLNPKQLLKEVYPQVKALGKGKILNIPDIYIKLPYQTVTRKGKPITRQRYMYLAAIAATCEKQADGEALLPEAESQATFNDVYLLISNRADAPAKAAQAYLKRLKIEVFYRTTKQNLGLTACYAQSEAAHLAHVELLFTAMTLICYASWPGNKEGADQAPPLCQVMRYFFIAFCRIDCYEQLIQVYFDTSIRRFSKLIDKFWPRFLNLELWSWQHYPETA